MHLLYPLKTPLYNNCKIIIATMKNRIVHGVAGLFIVMSLLLAHFVNINWLWITAFVGLNLFQSSITCFCPLEKILDYVGVGKEEKIN